MARKAYRLMSNKYEPDYVEAGFTIEEAKKIIDMAWDDDKDFTSKNEYIKTAKKWAENYSKKFGKKISWILLYGEPEDSDYMYCSKCDCFFYEADGCECDY